MQLIVPFRRQAAQTIYTRESGVHNLTLLRRKIVVISEMHTIIIAIKFLLNLILRRDLNCMVEQHIVTL